jgi:outer membrane murein-binding lipoprotein Lpp
MTKKILLSAVVTLFTFSGCLNTDDAKPDASKITKAADKLEANATKASNSVKKASKTAKEATAKVEEITTTVAPVTVVPPAESSFQDQVIEQAVEVADDKTDGMATQVIESVE